MRSISKAKQLIIAIAIAGCLPLMAQAGGDERLIEVNPYAAQLRDMELKKFSAPLRFALKPNLTPVDCDTFVQGESTNIYVEVENNGDMFTRDYEVQLKAMSLDNPTSVDVTQSQRVQGLSVGETREYHLGAIPTPNPGPGQSYVVVFRIWVDGGPNSPGVIDEYDEGDNSILCSETYYGY